MSSKGNAERLDRKAREKSRAALFDGASDVDFPGRANLYHGGTLRLRRDFLMNFAAEEFPNSQSHLHRIDPRIRRGQPGVRYVHVAQFETYVTFCAENMYAEGGLVHEVHGVGSGGNVVAGEEGASGEFE